MSRPFTPLDLARLPLPDAVEALDYESILAELKADLATRSPELAGVLSLESDPLTKLLEVVAFRELLLRARVNDAVRAVHLATAGGADLDGLAALFGVARLVVAPADPGAVPPVAAEFEADADLRKRAQMALEGFSTAGPAGAYEFHARSADARISDVAVSSINPGEVRIIVLSREGDGTASIELLDRVTNALTDERVRPLCDSVNVLAASIIRFDVIATLAPETGPGVDAIMAMAVEALNDYVARSRLIGRVVRRSGILAALHRPGIEAVTLTSPAADVDPGDAGAAIVDGISLGWEVVP